MVRPPIAISAASGGVGGYLLALVSELSASPSPVQAWTLAGVPTSELLFEFLRRIVPQHDFIVLSGLGVISAAFVVGAAVGGLLSRFTVRGPFSSSTFKVTTGSSPAYRLDGGRGC